MITRRGGAAVAVALLGLLPACGGKRPSLSAEAASFDVAVGRNERLMVGVSDVDGNVLAGGKVKLTFRPLNGDGAPFSTSATFLSVPGRAATAAATATKPRLVEPSEAVGVYTAADVSFPSPGPWEIGVDAGGAGKAVAAVMVNDRHEIPLPGDKAPATRNPTIATPGVVPGALDSSIRDSSISELTDRQLHVTSVADALAARRPLVVVVSTPVYCVSRFCGPTTDEVAKLATAHPKVTFVHLEVWEDYDKGRVSPFAAQWISPGADPTADAGEPWVFAVDRSGVITKRWDNVLDVAALRAEVTRLERSAP